MDKALYTQTTRYGISGYFYNRFLSGKSSKDSVLFRTPTIRAYSIANTGTTAYRLTGVKQVGNDTIDFSLNFDLNSFSRSKEYSFVGSITKISMTVILLIHYNDGTKDYITVDNFDDVYDFTTTGHGFARRTIAIPKVTLMTKDFSGTLSGKMTDIKDLEIYSTISFFDSSNYIRCIDKHVVKNAINPNTFFTLGDKQVALSDILTDSSTLKLNLKVEEIFDVYNKKIDGIAAQDLVELGSYTGGVVLSFDTPTLKEDEKLILNFRPNVIRDISSPLRNTYSRTWSYKCGYNPLIINKTTYLTAFSNDTTGTRSDYINIYNNSEKNKLCGELESSKERVLTKINMQKWLHKIRNFRNSGKNYLIVLGFYPSTSFSVFARTARYITDKLLENRFDGITKTDSLASGKITVSATRDYHQLLLNPKIVVDSLYASSSFTTLYSDSVLLSVMEANNVEASVVDTDLGVEDTIVKLVWESDSEKINPDFWKVGLTVSYSQKFKQDFSIKNTTGATYKTRFGDATYTRTLVGTTYTHTLTIPAIQVSYPVKCSFTLQREFGGKIID